MRNAKQKKDKKHQSMKSHNNLESSALPDVQIAISYSTLYNDYDKVNPYQFIKDIPTLAVLNFVVTLQNKVLYAISDVATQRCMIKEMCPWLDVRARRKAWMFQKDNKNPLLMSCDTSFLMFRLALSNFVPFEPDDHELDLCEDEMEGVYKAILYCNQKWTDIGWSIGNIGKINIKNDSMFLAKLSMRVDLPIVEFKAHKDFRTQFYKAIQFFKFSEADPIFSTYLPAFYCDHKTRHWKEYLMQLFNFFYASLDCQYISLDDSINPLPISVHSFFGQFTIEIDKDADELKELWTSNKGMAYLRNHFLLRVSDKIYLLLNANLLIDKMYQGMKFDFFNSIKTHNLTTKDGKRYSGYPHFSSVVGEAFSEPKMLYPFLHKCFDGIADKLIEGETFKNDGMCGEPDFYIREGDTLFLFEYKDLTLGDSVKFSQNEEMMKQQILERICYDGIDSNGEYKRKGGGQLLATINELLNNRTFDKYDSGILHIKNIYPIIVTTDSAFSSLGVNALVIDEFDRIKKEREYKFGKIFVSVPIIMDFDILIKLGYLFSIKNINLRGVLQDYISYNKFNISPFNTYVIDNILKGHNITTEENSFLFAEMFEE